MIVDLASVGIALNISHDSVLLKWDFSTLDLLILSINF